MKIDFIYTVLKIIEKKNVFVYAYKGSGAFKNTFFFAVDNYNTYSKDEDFLILKGKLREIANKKRIKIIFIHRKPLEKILKELNDEENLFILI